MTGWLASLHETPPWARALAVALLLALVALVDYLRHRERGTRWREYAFWLVCGLLGALFGVANDLVTSRLSPPYFALGKGLGTTDPAALDREVVLFAMGAGFGAGLAVGGAILLANNPRKGLPQLPYAALARSLVIPALAAIAGAPIVALSTNLDIQGLSSKLRETLSAEEVQRFLMVQRLHLGLYAGALAGTTFAVVRIRRRRRMPG